MFILGIGLCELQINFVIVKFLIALSSEHGSAIEVFPSVPFPVWPFKLTKQDSCAFLQLAAHRLFYR